MISAYACLHMLLGALDFFRKISSKDVVSWNSIIKGCIYCSNLATVRKLFDEMPHRNIVTWTTLIIASWLLIPHLSAGMDKVATRCDGGEREQSTTRLAARSCRWRRVGRAQ
ncbi:hypothetical protein HN51_054748 [Arachis hypogaea]